jgi:hypothetical protein
MAQDKTQEQIDYYRGRIKEMLRRVPASVNGGSYETAVAFKKLAAQALKAADSSKPKLVVLTSMHQQLSSYY